MKRIIIFASGSGTNTEQVIKYFKKKNTATVTHVFSNNSHAGALKRAHHLGVKALYFDRDALYTSNDVLHIIKDAHPDLIVLAGFLWRFPTTILEEFPNQVINIHPALLPKYGGKGMYGDYVHEAVIKNKDKESGITIHFVNEHYDEGAVIFQAKTAVAENDTADGLAKKIRELEHQHFPEVIEELLFQKQEKV